MKWYELPVFRQVLGIAWLALWLISLLSLLSYDPNDLAFSSYPPNPVPSNIIGWFGAELAWSLYWGFGFGAYLLCLLFFWFFLACMIGLQLRWLWKPVYVTLFLISACGLFNLQHTYGWDVISRQANVDSPGGLVGLTIIDMTVPYLLNQTGAAIMFGLFFGVSTLFLFDLNPRTTFLGAFAKYKAWQVESERKRYMNATEEERLVIQEQMLRRKEREALDELKRIAAMNEKKAVSIGMKPTKKDFSPVLTKPTTPAKTDEARKMEELKAVERELEALIAKSVPPISPLTPKAIVERIEQPRLTQSSSGDILKPTPTDVPKTDEPPKTEEPKRDEPKQEEPKIDEPKKKEEPVPTVEPTTKEQIEAAVEESKILRHEPAFPIEKVEVAETVIEPEPVILKPDAKKTEPLPVIETKSEEEEKFKALHTVETWVAETRGLAEKPTVERIEVFADDEVAVESVDPDEAVALSPLKTQPLEQPVHFETLPAEVPLVDIAAVGEVPVTAAEPSIRRPPPVVKMTAPVVSSGDSKSNYKLPEIELLAEPDRGRSPGLSDEQLRQNLATIVDTLRLFGVQASPGDITPGATITRYEVYPAAGVRVDKISSLSKDLSRVLCAERINVLAPIPGKDSVGIEVPNSNKVAVFLRELLESRDWHTTRARIPIALGKDVYGKTLVADLAEMPHMLIGGTTGSGKSVCINCILLSFLFRFSPEEMRLILIDPKQVEMQVYNAIPHLVVPVVTDPKKVMLALKWVINEMEKRYQILAKTKVRNIATFNARKREEQKRVEPEPQMELMGLSDEDEDDDDSSPAVQSSSVRVPREDDIVIPDRLPYIVVIIDELADLMQTAPADVESAVARLTAKARAAGIHLIVATQTPRREVVTGVIKTNIPARIAFQVPSGLDSRVILDENGAENLLGRGDLMYKPPGVGRLVRGQGAFVSDDEVQAVVKCCGDQAAAVFNEEIHSKLSGRITEDISEDDQRLIVECFEVIRQERKASTSNLQRRLRLGYNRAAYVIDFLERTGVLGPGDGAKPREILVDLDSHEIRF